MGSCSAKINQTAEKAMYTMTKPFHTKCCGDVYSNEQTLEGCVACRSPTIQINDRLALGLLFLIFSEDAQRLPMDLTQMIFQFSNLTQLKRSSTFLNGAFLSAKQHKFTLSEIPLEDKHRWNDWRAARITTNCEVFNKDLDQGAQNKTYQFTFSVKSGSEVNFGISTGQCSDYFYPLWIGPTRCKNSYEIINYEYRSKSLVYYVDQITIQIRYDNEKNVCIGVAINDMHEFQVRKRIKSGKNISIEMRSKDANFLKRVKFIGFKTFTDC